MVIGKLFGKNPFGGERDERPFPEDRKTSAFAPKPLCDVKLL